MRAFQPGFFRGVWTPALCLVRLFFGGRRVSTLFALSHGAGLPVVNRADSLVGAFQPRLNGGVRTPALSLVRLFFSRREVPAVLAVCHGAHFVIIHCTNAFVGTH